MKTFHLPDLGEGLAEAEIREWYVKVGDNVQVDQPLLSMETAKAIVDVPSPYKGTIAKLYGKEGEMIKTHAPLIDFSEEGVSSNPSNLDKGTVVGNLETSDTILEEEVIVGVASQATMNQVKAMPVVRALAKQFNVDINLVPPSGPQGQITAEDVKKFAEQKTNKGSAPEALRGSRHFMARAMMRSHEEVVAVTIVDDADLTNFKGNDFTVLMIQAIIAGIKAEPALNAWFDGNSMSRQIHEEINLGLAVDTAEGLFVPVIKDIGHKTASTIRSEINRVKKETQERTLAPVDFQNGTITLSNFGVFAGRYATVVIVPPMVAIIGCGKIREEASVYEGKIAIRKCVPLSLSFDHRAVTGGEATRFLAAVIKYLENN